MDKILVVFYSYTGTSRRLVQLLCSQLDWPSGEIVEERARSGASGTLRCVADSLLRRQPRIRYQGPDPGGFGTVVLVSPIWAYRLASPMRSFVAERRDDLQQIAVVSVMGGSGAPNAVAEIGHLLGRAPLLATAFTTREVDDGSCAGRLEAFGHALQAASRQASPVRPASWSPLAG
ncbi:MAG: flavodoxin [Polaromonas sp.]|uniref:flavodoxin family protein n=1 Tax=Polaromonas sp. TaxID=1869339 RepID=UPI0027167037|nr:flavodoxin [Polaromonas sp.]MDO9113489.1 flavodoxin [Polaromonas sp.]MDP1886433.1 flavodoxin [Polaromonas sp.]